MLWGTCWVEDRAQPQAKCRQEKEFQKQEIRTRSDSKRHRPSENLHLYMQGEQRDNGFPLNLENMGDMSGIILCGYNVKKHITNRV